MHPEIDPDIFKIESSSRESSEGRGTDDGQRTGEDAKDGLERTKKDIVEFWKLIFEQSAIVGQDWRLKTARELFLSWQSKVMYDWHHTASIMSVQVDTTKIPYHELHRYLKKPERKKQIATSKKSLLVDKLRG